MQTQKIPQSEWRTFFDTFSRQHEGWLATLEILGLDVGAQEEAHELPLAGVSLSSGGDETEAISIDLGTMPALEIEVADGTKTILRFRSPMPAEFVDGVVVDH